MLENLEESMLELVAKRGNIGASRDDLFKGLKGVAYSEMEMQIEQLEKKGYIAIQWLGSYDFVATITDLGLQQIQWT
jgi:hypothetical protein